MGAWIETCRPRNQPAVTIVAPHVGAWIETVPLAVSLCQCNTSHPMWVRGLKRQTMQKIEMVQKVAPHVGAWIETE